VNVPILSTPLRTLLAGTVMAASAVVLALAGDAIGVPQPWPVLLAAGAGLLVGVPRFQHGLALAVGATIGLITTWLGVAVLPESTTGVAVATGTAVLIVTVVTLVSHGRLRFGLQLVGWGLMTALSAPLVAPGAPAVVGVGPLLRVHVTVLVASGFGLLVAQVAQLLATGVSARRGAPGPRAAAVVPTVVLGVALCALATAPGTAAADDAPVVQHQQLIVRTHTPDGTPGRGVVVTRIGAIGTGDLSIELRDQAVTGLRGLSGLGASTVRGSRVIYELVEGTSVRTVADLDRVPPVSIRVVYRLDGEPIPAAALVGRSGRLDVTYTVENRTAEVRELRYFDAKGRARTVTRDVAVPFAGTLTVMLDDRFNVVRSDGVSVVADRVGRQDLHAELVLFGPVGAPVRTVTWSADVRDAMVPAVQVRVVPVAVGARAGAADAVQAEAFASGLRDLADAGGLLRTGLTALGVGADAADGAAATVLAQSGAVLDGLLEAVSAASVEVNEARALLAVQDERRRSGEGEVYGLLSAGTAVPPGVRVDAGVVYVLEVRGIPNDGGPAVPLRFGLALVLLAAVGLLGRAVGALTGTDAAIGARAVTGTDPMARPVVRPRVRPSARPRVRKER
jgi:hypothetical protein